jgi:O-antigen ligase
VNTQDLMPGGSTVAVDDPAPADGANQRVDASSGFLHRWVSMRFESYGRASIVMAVFLATVVMDAGVVDSFALIKLTALWCLGVVAIGCWLARARTSRYASQRSSVQLAALVFFTIFALATATSTARKVSILGLPMRYGGLVPLALYIGLMFACIGLYRPQPRRLAGVAWASVAGAAVVSGYVLIQAAGLDPAHWSDSVSRAPDWPIGTLGNSNFAGSHLAILMPFTIYALATRSRRGARVVLALLLGIEVLSLWYTQTRGGMIAAGVSLAVMVYAERDRVPRWLPRVTACAAAAALVGAVLVIWHPGLERSPSVLQGVRTNTLANRIGYWRAGTKVAIKHPLLGTGPDTFYAQYPTQRSASEARRLKLSLADKPHNIFVEYAANIGFVGLGAYLAVIGGALWLAWRQLRDGPNVLLLAFLGALVAYVVQGAFSMDEPPTAAMGWICVGGIVALTTTTGSTATATRAGRTRPRFFPVASYCLIALVVGGLLFIGTLPLRASAAAHSGDLDGAMKLQPLDASYPRRAGDLHRVVALATTDLRDRAAHLDDAARYYRRALRLQPNDLDLTIKMAVVASLWAESIDPSHSVEAERWWQAVLRADPYDPTVIFGHSDWQASMRARAGELGQLALADANNAAAWAVAAEASAAIGDGNEARARAGRALAIDPGNSRANQVLHALPA